MKKREPYSKFKGYLVEKNIPQKKIAELLCISEPTLSKRLNGKGGDFSVQDLKKICDFLQIKADIFFN